MCTFNKPRQEASHNQGSCQTGPAGAVFWNHQWEKNSLLENLLKISVIPFWDDLDVSNLKSQRAFKTCSYGLLQTRSVLPSNLKASTAVETAYHDYYWCINHMLGKNKCYWKEGTSTQVSCLSGLLDYWFLSFYSSCFYLFPVGPGCLFTKYVFYYFLCHMLWPIFMCTAKACSLQAYLEIQEWNSSLGQICYNLHSEKHNIYVEPAELCSARALSDTFSDWKIRSWDFHTQVRHSEYFFIAPRKVTCTLTSSAFQHKLKEG